MKVKDLLTLLQSRDIDYNNLYITGVWAPTKVITSIKLDISSVTLFRSGVKSYHFNIRDVLERLKLQDYKDVYYEIDCDDYNIEKTKLSFENLYIG